MPRKSEPTLRNTVRKFRTEANQTQQELANQVGVTRQTIVALETSAYAPSLPLAMRIARAFEVSVEDIFSLDE
jgi:putative transcriptional regulator